MIRKAEASEIDILMEIYAHARTVMKENGNPHQWGEHWPDRQQVEEDIAAGGCYVVEEGDRIQGVFYFAFGPDATYAVIEQGSWLNDKPYGVLHRIAAAPGASGILRAAVDFAAGYTDQLRIDTHADNHKMQYLLESCGFVRCGIIYVEDNTARIGYHRSGKKNGY